MELRFQPHGLFYFRKLETPHIAFDRQQRSFSGYLWPSSVKYLFLADWWWPAWWFHRTVHYEVFPWWGRFLLSWLVWFIVNLRTWLLEFTVIVCWFISDWRWVCNTGLHFRRWRVRTFCSGCMDLWDRYLQLKSDWKLNRFCIGFLMEGFRPRLSTSSLSHIEGILILAYPLLIQLINNNNITSLG